MQFQAKRMCCNHTCAFLRRPPVLPPKMGDGVLGSKVGGFQGAFSCFFSCFFSSAIALVRERALLGSAALLRIAVPLKALWRDGAAHRGAADIIVAAMAANQWIQALPGAQCSEQVRLSRVSPQDKRVPVLADQGSLMSETLPRAPLGADRRDVGTSPGLRGRARLLVFILISTCESSVTQELIRTILRMAKAE